MYIKPKDANRTCIDANHTCIDAGTNCRRKAG